MRGERCSCTWAKTDSSGGRCSSRSTMCRRTGSRPRTTCWATNRWCSRARRAGTRSGACMFRKAAETAGFPEPIPSRPCRERRPVSPPACATKAICWPVTDSPRCATPPRKPSAGRTGWIATCGWPRWAARPIECCCWTARTGCICTRWRIRIPRRASGPFLAGSGTKGPRARSTSGSRRGDRTISSRSSP